MEVFDLSNSRYVFRTCSSMEDFQKILSEYPHTDYTYLLTAPMEIYDASSAYSQLYADPAGYLVVHQISQDGSEALVYFVTTKNYDNMEYYQGIMPRFDLLMQSMGYTRAISEVDPPTAEALQSCGWIVESSTSEGIYKVSRNISGDAVGKVRSSGVSTIKLDQCGLALID